uniref:Uncharacterized protein n=1 Tax=Picea sitchensis TaxID=3332 RepID=A9NPX1_PICSI|nr:unknown [Picea sitchensis]
MIGCLAFKQTPLNESIPPELFIQLTLTYFFNRLSSNV